MVAKITTGKNLYGALLYNMKKVDASQAHILYGSRIFDSPRCGKPDMESCMESFRLYLDANKSTTNTVFHVSLNPDPKDNLSDARLSEIAKEYMERMGYGNQPCLAFTHEDIFRKHIHIVSVRVDENGDHIDDSHEWDRSMSILRELETKYGLYPSLKGQTLADLTEAKKVEYGKENLKQQIASTVRLLTQSYRFGSLTELNVLLRTYNVELEERKGETNGKPYRGIVYHALDGRGQ